MNKKEAESIAGPLSNPSKMPGRGTSTPATACKTGSKLRQVPGSTCHGCYAYKGMYQFPAVQAALQRRLDALRDPQWVDAMVRLVAGQEWFRWHDSGDIQGVWHLANIAEVARRTPDTHHWIPTREYKMVADYRKGGGTLPPNLVVRLSAHMVDGPEPIGYGLPTSTVVTGPATCPAPTQGNKCADCRACWSPDVQNVSYHKH
jgi:hypothetical protein